MARIYRDAYGVPHLRAASVLDLAHAQGEVTAHDRAWQLEWLRRRATGTTAEVFGEPGLPWDRFARRTLLLDTARLAYDALGAESRAFVAAYADGVNAGLHSVAPELTRLDIAPQPWPSWMPLAVFHAQHLLFAGLGGVLWRRLARSVLGDDAALLSHEGPALSGSNAWAAAGGRTASGLPLIGGDPHRIIESPGFYQQIRLACEHPHDAFDVVGFTFVGVPGIQHFAQTETVAWAITNAMAHYQDAVEEESPPRDVVLRRTEQIAVRGSDPVAVEVVRTSRGVMFEDGLSLRDASTELGDLGFEALLPLLRARTVDDVDRALDAWVAPVNNVVIADAHGAVRYRIAGRVPTRDGPTWTGWVEPPRHEVPHDAVVVSANERRGQESDAIGVEFAPPYRARRLADLLEGRTDLTAADFAAMHNDTVLLTVPGLTSLVPGAFDGFDAHMDADSAAAGRFAAWRSALVRRIAAEPVFAPFRDPAPEHRHDPVFAAWLDVTSRIALSLPGLVAAGRPFGIDLPALAREALAEVDAAPPRAWGDTHVFAPLHGFESMGLDAPGGLPVLAVDGDQDCVRCTTSYPADTDTCFRGSVARYVWDLADRSGSGWVVPTGAAGHPGDLHHHDQLAAWVTGDLLPVVTDWSRLVGADRTVCAESQ